MKNELLNILTETAIETLSEAHGASVADVKTALMAGQEIVCREFQKLMQAGLETVREMKTRI